jgi:hypothetical protein
VQLSFDFFRFPSISTYRSVTDILYNVWKLYLKHIFRYDELFKEAERRRIL